MRRLLAAILALSALSGAAAPRTVTWTLPTLYDDGTTPLPAGNVVSHNIYLLGTGAAPLGDGQISVTPDPRRLISTGSGVPTFALDIQVPTWVKIAACAIEPGGDPALGCFEGERSVAVLIRPKLRAKAVASPGVTDVPATECLPAGRVCVLP
jgi:hypothetical protein